LLLKLALTYLRVFTIYSAHTLIAFCQYSELSSGMQSDQGLTLSHQAHAAIASIGDHVHYKASDWLSSNLYSHLRQPSVLTSVVPSLHLHQRPMLQASVIAARQVAQKMPLVTNQE
jgi:hypothetical protein